MDLSFRTNKLRRICEDERRAVREHGADNARKLRLRLVDIRTSATLADLLRITAARCHDLHGDREGEWAVPLQGLWRLVFRLDQTPLPRTAHGEVDLAQIVSLEIVRIEDYH